MKKITLISLLIILLLIFFSFLLSYINSGFISIKTSPKDATVFLDKKRIKNTLKKIRIKKGSHIINTIKDGYLKYDTSFDLKKGETKSINIKLIKDISEFLPENNDHFQIEMIDESYYEVTLYPILNRPDQLESYNEQMKDYKKESIEWLKEKGIDTNIKDKIKFIPEEAENI